MAGACSPGRQGAAHRLRRPKGITAGSSREFVCTGTKDHDGDCPIQSAEGPKVRLAAIAARELDETCSPGHPCPDASGASAQAALEHLALGQTLAREATGTSYGRVTAWCRRPTVPNSTARWFARATRCAGPSSTPTTGSVGGTAFC